MLTTDVGNSFLNIETVAALTVRFDTLDDITDSIGGSSDKKTQMITMKRVVTGDPCLSSGSRTALWIALQHSRSFTHA